MIPCHFITIYTGFVQTTRRYTQRNHEEIKRKWFPSFFLFFFLPLTSCSLWSHYIMTKFFFVFLFFFYPTKCCVRLLGGRPCCLFFWWERFLFSQCFINIIFIDQHRVEWWVRLVYRWNDFLAGRATKGTHVKASPHSTLNQNVCFSDSVIRRA